MRSHNVAPFTWTACLRPSPDSPLLCADPKWSGGCKEEYRCGYKIGAPLPKAFGFWGLAVSRKHILNECLEFFLRKSVISIHPENLEPWLKYLEQRALKYIELLHSVTLTGPNTFRHNWNREFNLLNECLPNLKAVGSQGQDSEHRWLRNYVHMRHAASTGGEPTYFGTNVWRSWNITGYVCQFDCSITIALEAMVLMYPNDAQPFRQQQASIRILRDGRAAIEEEKKEGGSNAHNLSKCMLVSIGAGKIWPSLCVQGDMGWERDDVRINGGVSVLEKPQLDFEAPWREWWRRDDVLKGIDAADASRCGS